MRDRSSCLHFLVLTTSPCHCVFGIQHMCLPNRRAATGKDVAKPHAEESNCMAHRDCSALQGRQAHPLPIQLARKVSSK